MSQKHYHGRQDWQLAFIDMLLLMVGLFASLYIVTLLQMNPPETKSGVEMKAEYVITMTWPNEVFDDIDTHLLLPTGQMVNFKNRDTPMATLDRDDRGASGDVIVKPNGDQELRMVNQEIITIRTQTPGTYAVNLHVFQTIPTIFVGMEARHPTTGLPFKAHVKLTKLNPRYTDVIEVDVTLTEVGEQVTAFSFDIDDQGNVVKINTTDQLMFIPTRPNIIPDDIGTR